MRKKATLAGVISAFVLVVGLMAFPAGRLSATSDHHGKKLHFVERATGITPVDLPPAGASAGDELVFDNPLYDHTNTTQVGTSKGVSVQVDAAAATIYHCGGTLVLAGGQITFQGVADFAQPTGAFAVTGGTGKYNRAHGQISFTETPTTVELKVELK